jgi:heat shock protein HslJ
MKSGLAALLLICAGLPARAEVGDWVLTHVDGAAVGYSATLNLSQAGQITGQAPCNRYFADVTLDGAAFTLGPIGATKMACAQMADEADFFSLLGAVQMIEQAADRLVLRGATSEMVFVPEPK